MAKPTQDIHERLKRYTVDRDGCWCWVGPWDGSKGYGRIKYKGRNVAVHRLSLHLYKGFDLSSTLQVCHKPHICKFKNCWNPEHLYAGTNTQNQADRYELAPHYNSVKTHCKRGHEYTEENVYVHGRIRHCIKCNNIASEKKRERKRNRSELARRIS